LELIGCIESVTKSLDKVLEGIGQPTPNEEVMIRKIAAVKMIVAKDLFLGSGRCLPEFKLDDDRRNMALELLKEAASDVENARSMAVHRARAACQQAQESAS
jgi:hypothetical protein